MIRMWFFLLVFSLCNIGSPLLAGEKFSLIDSRVDDNLGKYINLQGVNSGFTVRDSFPDFTDLKKISGLPDPFLFLDGTKVKTMDEWLHRREEILQLVQKFELGQKPYTPNAATSAIFEPDSNVLKIIVNQNNRKISFECKITYPKDKGMNSVFPAVITIGWSGLAKTFQDLGVATIMFPNNLIAEQLDRSSRGKGLFFELFGSDASAGALMAWAWGVSRLIDALEMTPEARINTAKLGVTGCSRNGKGALIAGAFDSRIYLTIPQEPGAGGIASWRISDEQLAEGKKVQTLSQIIQENVWFGRSFNQFSGVTDKLPFDQHSVVALIAPRPALIIENSGIDWLSPFSSWISANASRKVWNVLEVPDRFGFTQVAHGDHCNLPVSQEPDLKAFVMQFLLGDANQKTSVLKSDRQFDLDEKKWINWDTPVWTN